MLLWAQKHNSIRYPLRECKKCIPFKFRICEHFLGVLQILVRQEILNKRKKKIVYNISAKFHLQTCHILPKIIAITFVQRWYVSSFIFSPKHYRWRSRRTRCWARRWSQRCPWFWTRIKSWTLSKQSSTRTTDKSEQSRL